MRLAVVLLLVAAGLSAAACGPRPAPRPETRVAAAVTVEGVAMGGLTQGEATAVLQDLAAERYVPAKNARFADADGTVVAERPGRALDVAATAAAALAAPAGGEVAAVYRPLAPAVTAEALAGARLVGTYTTAILDDSPERMENIRLTAALLNNAVIAPGEEFSFNSRTGEPTRERGFQPAVVFVDGREEVELGGGMCQVSSTLYNAVLAAGLRVTERHAHSRPVSYVPPGQDATTYTDKDLRFVNTGRRMLIVRAVAAEKNLTVDLFALAGGA